MNENRVFCLIASVSIGIFPRFILLKYIAIIANIISIIINIVIPDINETAKASLLVLMAFDDITMMGIRDTRLYPEYIYELLTLFIVSENT